MGRLFSVVDFAGRVERNRRFWGNCWLVAGWYKLTMGGVFVIGESKYLPVWHVQFGPTLDELYEFHPVRPRRGFLGLIGAAWHYGRIRKVRR